MATQSSQIQALKEKVRVLTEALERAFDHISHTPHDEHCFTNDPNPDACCCVCNKDTELDMIADALAQTADTGDTAGAAEAAFG